MQSVVHEEVSSQSGIRGIPQFMGQSLGKTLDGRFGCVVGGITTVQQSWSLRDEATNPCTYGGFVIPCLDPVFIITALKFRSIELDDWDDRYPGTHGFSW